MVLQWFHTWNVKTLSQGHPGSMRRIHRGFITPPLSHPIPCHLPSCLFNKAMKRPKKKTFYRKRRMLSQTAVCCLLGVTSSRHVTNIPPSPSDMKISSNTCNLRVIWQFVEMWIWYVQHVQIECTVSRNLPCKHFIPVTRLASHSISRYPELLIIRTAG